MLADDCGSSLDLPFGWYLSRQHALVDLAGAGERHLGDEQHAPRMLVAGAWASVGFDRLLVELGAGEP